MKLLNFLLVVLSVNLAFAGGIKFEKLSLDQALIKAKNEKKFVFVDVHAVWCGPCKYLSKSVFTDDELGNYMNENFISIKIDGEKGEGPDLMAAYHLDAFPTMLYFSPDKELLNKVVGALGPVELLAESKKVVHPEQAPLYIANQKYESGEREREFLSEYITLLLNEEEDFKSVFDEFVELYPELDLYDEKELLLFCLMDLDLNNVNTIEFFENGTVYFDLYPDLVDLKLKLILVNLAEETALDKKINNREEVFEKVLPLMQLLYPNESISENDLNDIVDSYVEEMSN